MQIYRLPAEEELTKEKLSEFIQDHNREVSTRLKKLQDAYETRYDIDNQPEKPNWKPDNRIAVNFAKYIVDTMNGFFIGHPIKVLAEDEDVGNYVQFLDSYNDQDDNNAELSKLCSIFGRGYEMYYVDEAGMIGITYVSPVDSFMIYDDSVLERPRYFVRTYLDSDKVLQGSVSDASVVRHFNMKTTLQFTDEKYHGFNGVPATEYRENEEGMGIFEPVLSMIDAYNKAISEKANDVDYFADAYLKILGAALDEDTLKDIRENRIINFKGNDITGLIVEFLQKPDGDTTQEHLIDRLEKLIFQISMVANISDENFGTSSGISLKYKLQAMSNLAKTKERKFTSGMNRRYSLIFSNPQAHLPGQPQMPADAWIGLEYKFTLNYPANLTEEADIASKLKGIVSDETLLKILSVVEDVDKELEKIEEQKDPMAYSTDYPTARTGEADDEADPDNEAAEE